MTYYTLVTALPPTVGHERLIEFASTLAAAEDDRLVVMLQTQPHEPYPQERYEALINKFVVGNSNVTVRLRNIAIEQNPDTPGFREMWGQIMRDNGFKAGDTIVTSETYGGWLAEINGGRWMPYDIAREITPVKATNIRESYLDHWDEIMSTFKPTLLRKVTCFGAESVGKTTYAQALAGHGNNVFGSFLPEWARGYLEAVGPEVTDQKMYDIWGGQYAAQRVAYDAAVKPFVFQDTDLFSTLGYWRMYNPKFAGGARERSLIKDALETKSDVYLLLPSDIPFEADQLRYGGDKRESTDQYWIDLLEEFGLNYVVVDRTNPDNAAEVIAEVLPKLEYDRKGF